MGQCVTIVDPPTDEETLQNAGLSEDEIRYIRGRTTATPWSQNYIGYEMKYYVNDVTLEAVEVLAETNGAGGMRHVYTYGTQRITDEAFGVVENFAYDGQGNVRQVMQGGSVVRSLSYGLYGEVEQGSLPYRTFYGYNGEEHNPETGLQYLRARYYEAASARFTSQDAYGGEAEKPLTQNKYLYANGDPVNYNDPGGLAAVKKTISKAVQNTAAKIAASIKSVKAPTKPIKQEIVDAGKWMTHVPVGSPSLPSATWIRPLKIDMQILENLSQVNRIFCSTDVHRFDSTRKNLTMQTTPPSPPGAGVTASRFNNFIESLRLYFQGTANPRESLKQYVCNNYKYTYDEASELVYVSNAPYKWYPSGNKDTDTIVIRRVITAATKHYRSPKYYDYLGNLINKIPSELWPRKDSGWNTYADHGGYREIDGVMTGNLASDLPLGGQEGRLIMAAYDGTVVEAYYNFPGTLRKWGSQWYYDDKPIGKERVDALYPGIYQHTITGSSGNWTWGNHILIKYEDVDGRTLYFHYAHIRQSPQLAVGKTVRRGDIIGSAGTTGHSTGTHIHLEVWTSQSYSTRLPMPHQYLP